MRKIIGTMLFMYASSHFIYYIYTVTHVSYVRRELSSKDLSDGPLIIKDGILSGKVKRIASRRKFVSHKPLNNDGFHDLNPQDDEIPNLDLAFIQKFQKTAKEIFIDDGNLIYFIFVNGAYEKLTMNWLCNVASFQGSHQRVLIVSTSPSLCKTVSIEWKEIIKCLHLPILGYDKSLDWGHQKYINILTLRAQMMTTLVKSYIPFVLIETDSTWFRDPYKIFTNSTMRENADIIVPIKGYAKKGDVLTFDPMVVYPTNGSRILFEEMVKLLWNNKTLYDQDVLNSLCSSQFFGVICGTFEWDAIADGKWFKLTDADRILLQPYIVNNNYYVGVRNKENRQAVNGLWFLFKNGHCNRSKTEKLLNYYKITNNN